VGKLVAQQNSEVVRGPRSGPGEEQLGDRVGVSGETNLRALKRVPFARLFAEFGVVFLGVTLSLLADDWRQSRTDRTDERLALEELLADLEAGAVDMGNLRSGSRDDAEATLWIRHALGAPEVNVDSLSSKLGTIYNFYSYQAPAPTYAGLRAGGRLTLVRNDELRRDIIKYYEERQPYITGFFESYYDLWIDLRESVAWDVEWQLQEGATSNLAYGEIRLKRPWREGPSDPLLHHRLEMFGVLAAVIDLRTGEVLAENEALREAIRRSLSQ